jgi:hypothetical protein
MRIAALAAVLLTTCVAHGDDYVSLVRSTKGLLVHYRCDDAADAFADASGNKHEAKVLGDAERGVDSAFPSLGKALRLNKGAHLRMPSLGQHEAFTFELWLRVAKQPAEGIAGIYAADGWSPGWLHLNLRPAGVVELAINGTPGPYPLSEPDTAPQEKWTHLVATYDRASAEQKLYRDGRVVLEAPASPGPAVNFVEGSLGMWITGGATRPLEADVDEVAIYSVALTPAQVRQHYATAKGISTTPVDFAKQVRPILEKRCYSCHGPDAQEGHLRLDVRDWALRGGESGEPAIYPYAAEDSHLVKLLTAASDKERMPRDDEPLTVSEIALCTALIAASSVGSKCQSAEATTVSG